jgi:hypothetical protein
LSLSGAPASGSYAIYVGRNLTTDGSMLIGGSGDEVSSHWLEIVPGHALLGSIEARTELLFGLRRPQTDEMSRVDTQLVSCRAPERDRP